MPATNLPKVFLMFIAFVCSITLAQGQVITSGSDSVTVATTTADTLSGGIFGALKTWDKPSRAALLSAIIPGAGQAYNKRYWKVPIIYLGGAAIGYYLLDNHKKYLEYRSSLKILSTGGTDKFATLIPDKAQRFQRLTRAEQSFRRYRDYNIIFMILLYGLNVSEAYVDAHLKGFDISDNLSFKIQPAIILGPSLTYAPGLSINLHINKK